MDKLDYKKKYKELYMPGEQPSIIEVPPMKFIAIEGQGDPNDENGEYSVAISILYAISYTIKMSPKNNHVIDGFFEYVVPPLEGFWWMGDGTPGVDYNNKSAFQWISMIRLPDFVTEEVFTWAKEEAARKKKIDTSLSKLIMVDEGLCVQCLHIGSYDNEPATVSKMDKFVVENGYQNDFSETRNHHEIYLSDPRKTSTEKLKTIIRHPVTKVI